jgi:N,N'-diacetyllegionaminate synthase
VGRGGSILFLIPARGGSRRVPGKNLRLVGGIPLVGWAVRLGNEVGRAVGGGGHSVVCSTDDEAIGRIAAAWGAEVLARPAELSTDEATSVDVALHALAALEPEHGPFETLVLLQPTSPLTDPADVAAAIRRHRDSGGAGVTSVRIGHPAWWHHGLDARACLQPLQTATDARSVKDVLLAGAFYVIDPAALRRSRRFVVPGETLGLPVPTERAVDIDEEADLVTAEAALASRPVRLVPVGPTTIGGGPVLVIAEAGVNHNGDIELARRLVDAAASAGADAVKFQTFDPATIAIRDAPTADYQRRAGVGARDQRELLASVMLPNDAWAELQARASDHGLLFLSTPFDDRSADLLDRLGVPAFKVGSGELTNTPFIARLARRGRPLLVSTGMADMVEVATAVDVVRANGDPPLALLHCVSSYPAAPQDANLRAIETLRRAFGIPVGWSDHTSGTELAQAAAALGASLIEKHLTLDRSMLGPDHAASIEPEDFARMVASIRITEAALGNGIKGPVEAERDVAAVARRALYWRDSWPAGHEVTADDLEALRPAAGISPAQLATLLGRRTVHAVEAGVAARFDDLEGR